VVQVVIRHESGPLQGQVQEFSDDEQRILIGRDTDCHVQFPPDFTAVGRRHAELVWDAGRLEIRVNTRNPVRVDGSEAIDDLEIPDGATLQLGVDGPRFCIGYRHPSDVPPTQEFPSAVSRPDNAESLQRTTLRTVRIAAALSVALVLAVVGLFYLRGQSLHIQSSVDGIEAKLGRSGDQGTFAEAISATSRSVYLVLIRNSAGEDAIGTAWVASKTQLATNAHIGLAARSALEEGKTVVVRSSTVPARDLSVASAVVHPAYQAFNEEFTRIRPFVSDAAGQETPLEYSGAYDVALLQVVDPAALEPPLPIASREYLRDLKPGLPVAFVGFPSEGLLEKDLTQPIPTAQVANLIGATTFTRRRPLKGDGQLVEHSLPATGGASGSPIINNRGEVVALLNGGNVVNAMGIVRMPSAAMVNFGQRADVLLDLMEEDGELDVEPLRVEWSRDLAQYSARATGNKPALVEEYRKSWQGDATAVGVEDIELQIAGGDTIRYRGDELIGKGVVFSAPPGRYLVAAYSPGLLDVDVVVTADGQQGEDVVADDSETSRVRPALTTFESTVPRELTATALVYPPESQASGDGNIKVRLLIWRMPAPER
jgi:Trypsin-like peptidase domain/FHA domain